MKKVYVVMEGEYSDLCVMGVFSTKKRAKKFKKQRMDSGTEPRIDTYPLDDGIIDGKPIYSVCIDEWGTSSHFYDDDEINTSIFSVCKYGQNDKDVHYNFHITASNYKRAEKIAQERLFIIKANMALFDGLIDFINTKSNEGCLIFDFLSYKQIHNNKDEYLNK